MAVKQFGFKAAVGVLVAVLLATYGFYWVAMNQLHSNVIQLVEFTSQLEAADNFHSSIHAMLLDAEGFFHDRDPAYQEAYQDNRAVARISLNGIQSHAETQAEGQARHKALESARGIRTAYARYEKDLDTIMSGDFSGGNQHLARVAKEFNTIFKKYYLRLHDHHDHEQEQLARESSSTWHAVSVVFGLQLALALVAGFVVIFYLDRVVLRVFSVTERMAYRDKLTGLRNRTSLDKLTTALDEPSDRPRRRYCLIMLDIDHFKNFNDNYGHPAGDRLLSDFAKVITDNVRGQDKVVRYGGEEFLVVLPETSRGGGAQAAEKLRLAIAGHDFILPDGKTAPQVTASLGVAAYPGDGEDFKRVVRRADERLYRAKDQGRNQVVG
ncbi:MAG: GGDEF domain-containing protein [Desulfarculaceae bacterium]|nr:GGDEF domain-containing protein [Desulfarculaceae bacterium]MCF8072524.1 GGDEF domain-containing protein [Desulfarculaceae bacterium]MCF8103665.1 GGDEF domain-containing protein [Desulfarculaceae bacterium]MCF8117065.1 GGDEF domain-containing protein [Desulfarculaceae bacterium]